jgi:hypothetical protein
MKNFFILFLLFCFTFKLYAEEKKMANFIGIKPEVTIEPYYQKGELDVNIFPLVYQHTLNKRLDIRLASILYLGIREKGNSISHYGFQLAFPVYLSKKEKTDLPSKGFFVAPGIGVTRSNLEKHQNVGLWVEPGYHLLFDDNWAIAFGVQLGATHFNYDDGTTKWGNHFGIKICFGKWL